MRRARSLFLLLFLLPACGLMPEERTPVPRTRAQILQELARWSGAPWRVRYDPVLHTAAFLEGLTPPLAPPDRLGTAARDFLLRHRELFGLSAEDELVHVSTRLDELGMRHIRFVQARERVPVWGTMLAVHLDAQGAVRRVQGRTYDLGRLGRLGDRQAPWISAEAARQRALALVQAARPLASLSAAGPGRFLYATPEALTPIYEVEVEGQDPDLPVWRSLLLDARTGALVEDSDRLAYLDLPQPAVGSGTGALGDRRVLSVSQRGDRFYLEDLLRGKLRTTAPGPGDRLPGSTVHSPAADRWDEGRFGAGAAVDVHAHLMTLWDYFARHHRHFGWDGAGRGITAAVHFGDRRAVALFDGRRLVFGDGDGAVFLPLGAALDVVAHEYTHALVHELIGLRPDGESGALGEAIADLFACFIEQAVQGGGWTIGEAIHRSDGKNTPLRDLADPHRTGQARSLTEIQPLQGIPGPSGRRAREVAAGIAGHAGYLLAKRVGSARAAAIWYRTITTYLHAFSGFSDAAEGTLSAVRDLHGEAADLLSAVRAAWAAVGVETVETRGEVARP